MNDGEQSKSRDLIQGRLDFMFAFEVLDRVLDLIALLAGQAKC
jgi:hypothetical protein